MKVNFIVAGDAAAAKIDKDVIVRKAVNFSATEGKCAATNLVNAIGISPFR